MKLIQVRYISAALTPAPTRLLLLWLICLLALAGCKPPPVDTQYGSRVGKGKRSLNGTSVLADMFMQAGHQVTSVRRISPRLNQYTVIVWAPDDFNPPDLEQRLWLERWLSRGGRTLIYIGRDYDAAPQYWQQMSSRVDPVDALEMWRRRSAAIAAFENERTQHESPRFGRWFTRQSTHSYGPVTSVSTPADRQWLADIDVAKLQLFLGAALEPAAAADLPAAPANSGTPATVNPGGAAWSPDFENAQFYDMREAGRQMQLPSRAQVLLTSERGALLTRVHDRSWPHSTIYVVSNGSFLLNFALVNTEHRKLAGKLIDACDDPSQVAFLETSIGENVWFADPEDGSNTGFEVFTVWPLGLIVMHAFVLGIAACFAYFPIFGRPRELPGDARGDFGKHIEALGILLQRTHDDLYAREQLQQYNAQVRGEKDRRA